MDFELISEGNTAPAKLARPSAYSSLSSARAGWISLILLLLIELVSYHRMVIRDIEGLYPFSFDQAVYLMQAYEAFESFRTDGIWVGLKHAWFTAGSPTGVLLQGEAALAYLFLGASRTSSLLVLFTHFALLQIVLFAAFRRLSGRTAPGFIAISLLLFSLSRYFYAGGLSDFRLDHPAACLYGITLAAFICSDRFRDRRWTILFGISLTALVATRFISASYAAIAIVASVILIVLLDFGLQNNVASRKNLVLRATAVCGLSAAVAAVFMYANFSLLFNYYFLGHFAGPEKAIRAVEYGVADRIPALLFYPKSLAFDHLGLPFLAATATAFILAVASHNRREYDARFGDKSKFRLYLAVAVVWIAVPLALFTIDESKSPVVAGVMVPPAIIAITLVYILVSGGYGAAFPLSRFELATSVSLLFLAMAFNVSQNALRRPNLEMAKDATELYAAYDEIAADIQRNRSLQPKFATDSTLDYFNGAVAKVMTYERTGKLVAAQELLASTIMAVPKNTALAALENSDYALVTISHPAVERNPIYPFQKSMLEYRAEMQAYVRAQMVPLRRVQIGGHVFQIFQRPRIEILGISGDWLPNSGATIRLRLTDLRKFPHILLSGPTMHSRELKEGLTCNATFVSQDGQSRIPLPVKTYLGGNDYAIAIDASALISRPDDAVEIALDFPSFFVPSERGINADTRKLTVSVPKSTRLVEGTHLYPPSLAAAAK